MVTSEMQCHCAGNRCPQALSEYNNAFGRDLSDMQDPIDQGNAISDQACFRGRACGLAEAAIVDCYDVRVCL